MNNDINALRSNLRKFSKSNQILPAVNGKVTSVNEDNYTCEVELADGSLLNATLTCGDKAKGIVQIPKLDSDVIVVCFDGINGVVVMCDEIDKIIINGGELGGLVNINELTQKINDFISVFNSHTHVATTTATIGSSATPGTILMNTPQAATQLNKTDYEDKQIAH